MDAEKSVTDLSANAGPSQLELHALPGNFRSLNIVSGQIRDDEHAASPPGMLSAELAGKRWSRGFMQMIHGIKWQVWKCFLNIAVKFPSLVYLQNDLSKLVSRRVYNADIENLKDELLVVLFLVSDTSTPEPSKALDQPLGLPAIRIKKSGIQWLEASLHDRKRSIFFHFVQFCKKSRKIKRQPALMCIALHAQIIDCCCTNGFCLLSGVLLTLPRECHHQNSLDGRCIFSKRRAGPSLSLFTLGVFAGVIQLLR